MLVKFGRVLPLGQSKATFSSLQEASIPSGQVWKISASRVEQGHVFQPVGSICPFQLSQGDLYHPDARLPFPAFRKILSHLLKFRRSLISGFSKATFSSLLEASILIGKVRKKSATRMEQGHVFQPLGSVCPFQLSQGDLCHQDARLPFSVLRKILSHLLKFRRSLISGFSKATFSSLLEASILIG